MMIAVIFIPFFAQNIETLFVGQLLAGIPWGIFQTLTTAVGFGPVYSEHQLTGSTHPRLCLFRFAHTLPHSSTYAGSLVNSSPLESYEVFLTGSRSGLSGYLSPCSVSKLVVAVTKLMIRVLASPDSRSLLICTRLALVACSKRPTRLCSRCVTKTTNWSKRRRDRTRNLVHATYQRSREGCWRRNKLHLVFQGCRSSTYRSCSGSLGLSELVWIFIYGLVDLLP